MDTNGHEYGIAEIVEGVADKVVGAAYEVANVLGSGFLEKVYERALLTELSLRGLHAKSQVSFPVAYKEHYIGEYLADLLVEDQLIVELKCVDRFCNEHLAQCINQLPQGLAHQGRASDQFSEAESRVETGNLRSLN